MSDLLIKNKLIELGFKKTHYVEGRSSISALIGKRRCGIYVLQFANGDYYVGQSIRVTQRFAQHTKRHPDIRYLSFKTVNQKELDIEEIRITKALESLGVFLRNIKIVTFTHALQTDFDGIMPPAQQQEWETNISIIDLEGTRIHDDTLRRKYNTNYKRFLQLPFADDVTLTLRNYVLTTIPAIKRGEVDFWIVHAFHVAVELSIQG